MRIEIEEADQIAGPHGLEIGIKGFKANPQDADEHPTQVYIEFYEGNLQVHVWDGTSNDPQTVLINALDMSPK